MGYTAFNEVSEKLPKTDIRDLDYTDFRKITQIFRWRFNLCNLHFNRCNHKNILFQSSLNKKKHNQSMRGFSLVEAMAAVFIFSLIFAGLIMVLYGGQDIWYTADVQIHLNQEVRRPLLTMIRELRQTAPTRISLAQGNIDNRVVFLVPEDTDGDGDVIDGAGAIEWSTEIIYELNANNQIIRLEDGVQRILANDITNLQFSRSLDEPNIIEIRITAQRSTVWRRNLQASIMSSLRMRN